MNLLRFLSFTLLALLFVSAVTVTAEDPVEEDDEGDTVVEDAKEEPNLPKEERPVYKAPEASGNVYFTEAFVSEEGFQKGWILSKSKKDGADEAISKYDGVWMVEEPSDNPLKGDLGLVLKSKAKHHAAAALLSRPFEFKDAPFIVQYEVKFQSGQECGGAYIKLLTKSDSLDLNDFNDKTPYTIMFGPDKCGNDAKLHFIFRHQNPKTGKFEEKHAKKPSNAFDTVFSDKKTHLFTLVVKPDNTFEVFVDQDLVNSGSLLEDFEPPVNPPKEIIDPNDKKPEDWDEREKIPDPDATKPEDWDESEPEMIPDEDAVKPEGWLDDEKDLIPDPKAEKPSDWDDEMDGEWEAPMINNPACESAPGCGEWKRPTIKNPKYKGKWRPPMIDNPAYKGKWQPRKIPNPDFFEDKEPSKMSSIAAVGLELWSMSDNILFDNFIITDDKDVADKWASDSYLLKRTQELAGDGSGKSVVEAVKDMTNERPWLWAVFVLVVVLPIVLLIGYCCMGSSSKTGDAASHKKTDEATPADVPVEEEEEAAAAKEEEGEKQAAEQGAGDADKKKSSKSALEAQDQETKSEEPAAGDGDKKTSKSALEAEDEQAEEADVEEEEEKPELRKSPRKRRTRKD